MFSGSLRVLALPTVQAKFSSPPPSAFYSKLASVPLGHEKGATFPRTIFLPGKPPDLRVPILKSSTTGDCFTVPVGVCSPGANPRSVTLGTSGALAGLPLGGSWGERTPHNLGPSAGLTPSPNIVPAEEQTLLFTQTQHHHAQLCKLNLTNELLPTLFPPSVLISIWIKGPPVPIFMVIVANEYI